MFQAKSSVFFKRHSSQEDTGPLNGHFRGTSSSRTLSTTLHMGFWRDAEALRGPPTGAYPVHDTHPGHPLNAVSSTDSPTTISLASPWSTSLSFANYRNRSLARCNGFLLWALVKYRSHYSSRWKS